MKKSERFFHGDYQIIPADQYQDLLLTRLNNDEGSDIFGAQSGFALATTYNVAENAVNLSGEEWADAYSVFSAAENENMKTALDQLNDLAQKGYFGDN